MHLLYQFGIKYPLNIIIKWLHFFDLTHFRSLGQKSKNNFFQFLVQMRTRHFAFEIYWPLLHCIFLTDEDTLFRYEVKYFLKSYSDFFIHLRFHKLFTKTFVVDFINEMWKMFCKVEYEFKDHFRITLAQLCLV